MVQYLDFISRLQNRIQKWSIKQTRHHSPSCVCDVMVHHNLYAEFQVSATEQETLKALWVKEMMKEVWNMLIATLGIPPSLMRRLSGSILARGVLRRFDREPQSNFINSSLARSIQSVYDFIPRSSI